MHLKKTVEEINKIIKEFVLERYLFGYEMNEIGDDSSFLELGVLDSTGIIELVALVEQEFNIEVLDREIIPVNFDSINCICSFVNKKINFIEE